MANIDTRNIDQEYTEQMKMIHMVIRAAKMLVEPYKKAIPHDAPTKCRCKTTEMHCLPEEFAEPVVKIEFPAL